MKMQLYWVPWNCYPRSENEHPRPGQFVFGDNDDETVRGFVSEVDDNLERSLLCLFESTMLEVPTAEIVQAEITMDEVMDRLKIALDANPSIKPQWQQAMQVS
jgi:hypothetical protein